MSSHLIFVIGGWNGIDFYVAASLRHPPNPQHPPSSLLFLLQLVSKKKSLKVYARNNKRRIYWRRRDSNQIGQQ